MITTGDAYKFFAIHELPWCWACGRGDSDQPREKTDGFDWNAPWLLHRAHIVNKPRVEDSRAVVLLCPLCHDLSHGRLFPQIALPALGLEQMLWLKLVRDRSRYDREFLAKHCIGKLPEPQRLPVAYTNEYRGRRGGK